MALVLADRVRDTTTTTGTGTVTLSGTAPTGYQNFSVIGNANTTYYTINAGSQWEVGIGTYSSTGPTLARTTVLESSNANALVNFSVGTKDVFVTYPSDRAVTTDGVETLTNKTINGSNNTITNVSLTTAVTGTLPATNGGTGQSSYAVGDILFASTTTALSKLADVATGNALISGGVGVAPSYGKIGLTTHITGTLAVGNGGTGAVTLTTRGVLIGNGTNAVSATAAGTTGQVLVGNTGADPSWATLTSTAVTSFSAGTTGLTPSTATQGAITLAGTLGVANGGTGTATAFTAGSVVFAGASGVYSQNNGQFFWDNTNNRLGIGTTSPGKKLTVAASTDQLSLTTGTNELIARASSSEAALYTFQAIPLNFYTNNAERMRIDSSGNVGVGTTAPLARLFAEVPTSVGAAFAYAANSNGVYPTGVFGGSFGYNFSAGGAEVDFWNGWTGASGTQGGFAFRRQTGASSQNLLMTIRGDGNVGIGTSSPLYQATVLGLGQDTAALTDAGNKGGSLYLQATGVTGGSGGALLFGTTFGNQTPFAAIKGLVTDGTSNTIGNLAISTRNAFTDTALTERLRITAAGDVGIGTTAPGAKLDVVGVSLTRTDSSGGSTPLVVKNDSSANNTTKSTGLLFQGVDTVGTGKNTGVVQCGPSDVNYVTSYLAFQTRTADALSERMRITNTGNVGIGTSSPTERLDTGAGNTRTQALVVSGDQHLIYSADSSTLGIRIGTGGPYYGIGTTGSSNMRINSASGGDMLFAIGGTERMRVNSSGNVGIGETSPGAKLHVSGGTVGTTAGNLLNVTIDQGLAGGNAVGIRTNLVRVSSGTDWTTTAMRLQGRVDATDFGYIDLVSSGAQGMAFGSGGTERMRIDSSGNVGIGTSSPTSRLTITGGVTEIRDGNYLMLRPSGNAWDMRLQATGTQLDILSGASLGSPIMSLVNGGNVGIGTATPVQRLHVRQDQDGTTAALIQNRNGSGTPVSAVQFISGAFDLSDNRYAMISSAGGSNTTLQFWTGQGAAPTEKMRITSAGKVGIGTSSPDATAILDVSSTTAGFLPPRMSTAERDAIGGGAPQEGLILYNVTTDKLQVYSAGAWVNLH
jgi:hypothetical protein